MCLMISWDKGNKIMNWLIFSYIIGPIVILGIASFLMYCSLKPKCKRCGCRAYFGDWIHWHKKEGQKDYTGYVWCPQCDEERWEGFDTRVF